MTQKSEVSGHSTGRSSIVSSILVLHDGHEERRLRSENIPSTDSIPILSRRSASFIIGIPLWTRKVLSNIASREKLGNWIASSYMWREGFFIYFIGSYSYRDIIQITHPSGISGSHQVRGHIRKQGSSQYTDHGYYDHNLYESEAMDGSSGERRYIFG